MAIRRENIALGLQLVNTILCGILAFLVYQLVAQRPATRADFQTYETAAFERAIMVEITGDEPIKTCLAEFEVSGAGTAFAQGGWSCINNPISRVIEAIEDLRGEVRRIR